VMGPEQAVGILHRRGLAQEGDPERARERLAREYAEEHLTAAAAARQGFVDEIVVPSRSRARLAAALDALETGAGRTADYTNTPL